MSGHTMKKVIWAVDLDGDREIQDQAARVLRPILAATHATVEPVFVLSPKTRISAKHLPQWEKSYHELAEKRIAGLVSRCELPGIGKPAILFDRESSHRKSAELLVSDSKTKGADLIVVSTHARNGLPRFFLGSFAETLLLQSTIPVLTVNPAAQVAARVSRVLFPSDFGQPSRRGFEATVALCKQLGAKLWLYYKAPEPIPMAFPEAPILYQYVEEEEKLLKETGRTWADWGQKHGVEVSFVDDSKPGNVSRAILDFAQSQKIEMISMVAQSGPVASVVLGSVTRQVVRCAECPVWVQHSRE